MPSLHISASSNETIQKDSLQSYLKSGHGRTLPLTRRTPAPSENTPLVSFLPKVRFLPQPSTTDCVDSIDTARHDSPLRLFFHDALTLFYTIPYLPYALRPWKANCSLRHGGECTDGGNGDWSNWRTKRDDVVVGIASVCQVLSIPIVPVAFAALPGLAFALVAAVCGSANWAFVSCLRGKKIVRSGDEESGGGLHRTTGSRERWYFVNGIMTGREGVKSSVNHISQVFGRPVVGIHNWTAGFVGDIIECLIQRCFSYNTIDVRVTYDHLRSCLIDTEVDKVVLLAHSQGGIVASLVVDKLMTDLPQDCIGKLEIYTFGSAASHFSNPLLSLLTRTLAPDVKSRQENDKPSQSAHNPESPLPPAMNIPQTGLGITRSMNTLSAPKQPTPHQGQSESGESPSTDFMVGRTIPHIEHYANELDPIPRWGVLHSISDLASPRYAGRVFIRLGASGHLFSKHYLAALFPMDRSERGLFWGREVEVDEVAARERMGIGPGNNGGQAQSKNGMEGVQWGDGLFRDRDEWREVEEERGEDGMGDIEFLRKAKGKKVKELGRLWGYVDGGVPKD